MGSQAFEYSRAVSVFQSWVVSWVCLHFQVFLKKNPFFCFFEIRDFLVFGLLILNGTK